MALTVRDIMERELVTVTPQDDIETLVRLLRRHDLPGVPVVNDGGRCVGMVTEADLVISDEQGDLHLPHYIELFGGVVFLEPLRHFEETTIEPDAGVHEAGRAIAESGHNRLPVSEHGRLVGVVTRVDVLEALTREP
jgi:CBS domain-containing protein